MQVKEQGTMKNSKVNNNIYNYKFNNACILQYWKYTEVNSDEEKEVPVTIEGKRKRKPTNKFI